jgi:hypothetical protein
VGNGNIIAHSDKRTAGCAYPCHGYMLLIQEGLMVPREHEGDTQHHMVRNLLLGAARQRTSEAHRR